MFFTAGPEMEKIPDLTKSGYSYLKGCNAIRIIDMFFATGPEMEKSRISQNLRIAFAFGESQFVSFQRFFGQLFETDSTNPGK